MASLSSALNYALSGLSTTAAQSALTSRNVTFARDENYARRSADIITLPGGGASLSQVTRSIDRQLLEKMLTASSGSAGRSATLEAANRLGEALGEPDSATSLAGLLSGFQQSLKTYETDPSNAVLGQAAAVAAGRLTAKINAAAAEVQSVRMDADAAIADAVGRINALLDQFKVVNDAVVRGDGSSADLADNLDQRDAILKSLAGEIGIRTVTRPGNDLVLFTDSGVVLFEGAPRQVSFAPTAMLEAGAMGGAVVVDGVPVTGDNPVMALREGRLPALVAVRDRLAVTAQKQLDAVASALVRRFAERPADSASALPAVAGLFTTAAGGPVPAEGETVPGLARQLMLNPLADPDRGGNPLLIRDGGFGGAAYVANTLGQSGFQDRIRALADAIEQPGTVDPALGLGGSGSLRTLTVQSAGWIAQRRQTAQSEQDAASASELRASESLLRVTGVNIDTEMAALLDLEKAYQASSKIIGIVDAMLGSLMDAVR